MVEDKPISEDTEIIDSTKIGYCKYGSGPNSVLCICGAVGSYKKDWPSSLLKHFDPDLVTLVCIDPPGYGTSRPPDRVQEVNRCMKDAGYCLKLMEASFCIRSPWLFSLTERLEIIFKKLELIPFTVMGWSEGARTAIHVAGQGKKEKVTLKHIQHISSHLSSKNFL
ncbi:unnamed protein product [Strongylus vulgaris]|uniref:Uncharacterized protein n=1 Tax=Strongylus vulgaris TaxID=40348 RepID=A0A3P7J173_STRVU|nr:unnamed protein product [Strongylus vulgaris]